MPPPGGVLEKIVGCITGGVPGTGPRGEAPDAMAPRAMVSLLTLVEPLGPTTLRYHAKIPPKDVYVFIVLEPRGHIRACICSPANP